MLPTTITENDSKLKSLQWEKFGKFTWVGLEDKKLIARISIPEGAPFEYYQVDFFTDAFIDLDSAQKCANKVYTNEIIPHRKFHEDKNKLDPTLALIERMLPVIKSVVLAYESIIIKAKSE